MWAIKSLNTHILKQKLFHTWIAVSSWRIEWKGAVNEIVADNDYEHDEILDAAITYKLP